MRPNFGTESTFLDVLDFWATESRAAPAFSLLDRSAEVRASLDYFELRRSARSVAATLSDCQQRPVLILLPNGIEFIQAVYGCLLAGAIAVPAFEPHTRRSRHERLLGIVENAEPQAIITNRKSHAAAKVLTEQVRARVQRDIPVLVIEELTTGFDEGYRPPRVQSGDLAILQYTSGSTGSPKGVMVTHSNLMENVRKLARCHRLDASPAELVFVSWLPMFHDMGLVGTILQPCFHGGNTYLIDPAVFVQHPLSWLLAISRYRGTYSISPNFGYELCVARLSRAQTLGLDLASWRFALNGAEPVRWETMAKFAERFAENGFDATALVPGYGLAEATLCVSLTPPGQGFFARDYCVDRLSAGIAEPKPRGDGTRTLVSSGPVSSPEVVIVAEQDGATLPSRYIGEIWVQSPSVAAGYWCNPEETRRVFEAQLEGSNRPGLDERDGHYLRTGDLGFVDDGQLFVVGRAKDLIIINGQNVYPQDVEGAIRAAASECRAHAGAAFAIEVGGRERIAVVHAIDPRVLNDASYLHELHEHICAHVFREEGLSLHDLVLVAPSKVLRTSSGKIRRRDMRELYLRGEFRRLTRATLDAHASDAALEAKNTSAA